ncbi:integrase, catalytic region, zinc finger, CCHC-type containing protein [Tanacetum coccineum]
MDELIDHVSQKTYAYADIRAENENLLITISELKNRLRNVEKGKSVNTRFDQTNVSQNLLCVTPINKQVFQKKNVVSKTEEKHVVSKPVTLQISPKKQRGTNSNNNVIVPGMYRVVRKQESQTNETKHGLSSTGMNVVSSVRRPMNRDSNVKKSVLANSKISAKKVEVYVRKNKQTDTISANVFSNKENVIDVDVANAPKAKVVLCVSCMKNVLIPCQDKCLANYKLNVHSNVRRALFTKPRTPKSLDTTHVVFKTRFSKNLAQSKSLDTTPVVSKTKIDEGSVSKAKNKFSRKIIKLVLKSLAAFEKNFKEDAAKEEQLAIENISAILRNLISKQTLRVSQVSGKIDEVSSQDNKMMLQDVSNMMQVSDDGKTEANKYIEKVKSLFTEETCISTESSTLLENCREECTNKVGNSLQHWDNTKLAINRFNERNMVEIESFIRETIQVNNLRSEEIAAAYVSMDTKFQLDASDLKSCGNVVLNKPCNKGEYKTLHRRTYNSETNISATRLQSLRKQRMTRSKRTILDSILSEDVCIMPCKGINYISIYEDISKEPMLQVEFTEAGVCHGFALWIDWVMDSTNNIVMSTGPGGLINTSGYNIDEATPIMEWGRKGQNKKLSPAGALTFTRSSMAPARTVGWRDPGQDSLQRVIIFGDMGKIIMANIIPPDHVDDLPDPALAIPEPVLVDEDEDPEEEEFEEEEEPQEE